MCAESAVLIYGRLQNPFISELGNCYPHSLVCEFQEGCYISALDKHYPLLPGPAIVTVWKYILCITIFSKPSNDEKELHNMSFRSRQYYLQMCCKLLLILLLLMPTLHCYIINLNTVIIVCLLFRNSVSKVISKYLCIYVCILENH